MAVVAAAPSDGDSGETKIIRTAEEEQEQEGDLLSSLPDSMIGLVFSYLTIKEILRTSVVSRRWRRLWTKTSTICYASTWGEFARGFGFSGFASSLNRLFLLCPMPSIRRFRLEMILYRKCRKEAFDLWLRLAVAHRVVDLTVDVGWRIFSYRSTYVLPRFLFEYPALMSLRVRCCKFTLLSRVTWNSLRVLRVGGVEMTDDVIDDILRGSPELEHLWLERCWGMNRIRIDSRKLRELVIDGCSDPKLCRSLREEDVNLGGFALEVIGPHLVSLQILGDWYGTGSIRLNNVSSLAEGKLDFALQTCRYRRRDVSEMLGRLLGGLTCVGSLTIGNRTIQDLNIVAGTTKGIALGFECRTLVLHAFDEEFEHLELTALSGCTWNVERLVVNFDRKRPARFRDRDHVSICEGHFQRMQRATLKCLAARLGFIEINGFRAMPHNTSKHHLSLIRFLLRNALVLEKMVINAKTSEEGAAAAGKDHLSEELLKVEGAFNGLLGKRDCDFLESAETVKHKDSKQLRCDIMELMDSAISLLTLGMIFVGDELYKLFQLAEAAVLAVWCFVPEIVKKGGYSVISIRRHRNKRNDSKFHLMIVPCCHCLPEDFFPFLNGQPVGENATTREDRCCCTTTSSDV